MHTTNELLDQVKAKHHVTSDYKLALFLGMSKQSMTNYRHGRTSLSDPIAERVAELLDLDPGYVAACMQSERSATEQSKRLWANVAHRLQGGMAHAAALLLAVVVSLTVVAKDGHAAPALSAEKPASLYIMLNAISRLIGQLHRRCSCTIRRLILGTNKNVSSTDTIAAAFVFA